MTLVFHPNINKSSHSKFVRGKVGRGVGSFLLDGGLGGQSSYNSFDNYVATTKSPVPIGGNGLKGLEQIRNKMEQLKVHQPLARKPKNIKFTL